MTLTPRILPVSEVYRQAGVPCDPSEGRWIVVEGGAFGGRRWEVGALVAVDPEERDGVVLLVPRGLGRARFGERHGEGLTGEAGEACSPRRFVVAGTPVAAGLASPAVVRWCCGGVVLRSFQANPVEGPTVVAAPRAQLPLFQRAAA